MRIDRYVISLKLVPGGPPRLSGTQLETVMRFVSFERDAKPVLGVREGESVRVLGDETLESLLERGVDLVEYARTNPSEETVSLSDLKLLPPLRRPPKIICVGLN